MPDRRSGPLGILLIVVVGYAIVGVPTAICGEVIPLRVRIDALIENSRVGPAADISSDAEFLRRVSLDLTGEIPPTSAARDFLANESSGKRAELVDRLLASPQFARHMQITFDVMLMERRPDKHIKSEPWREYLRSSFDSGKPLDQLAREILGADGVDEALRPAAKFYLDRDGQTHLLTRDVGRMFVGKDFQCAQCHDHPLIDGYLQNHYYGIFAFLNRSFVFTDKEKKVFFAEKAEGDVSFESVFDKGNKQQTGPRLPGEVPIEEPAFEKGEEYAVKPAKEVRPVPKFSRREQLAKKLASGEFKPFNRNMANRLWAHVMGRGLVHPVDLHHEDNPATHAELLTVLADELVRMKFDVRAFLREIVLSQTYQRAGTLPDGLRDHLPAAKEQLASLEAELALREAAIVGALETAEKLESELELAKKIAAAATVDRDRAREESKSSHEKVQETNQKLGSSREHLLLQEQVANTVAALSVNANQAAKQLKGDQVIATAAQSIAARLQEIISQRDAARAEVALYTAQVDAAHDQMARTNYLLQIAESNHQRLHAQVDDLQSRLTETGHRESQRRRRVNSIKSRIQDAQTLIVYGEAALKLDNADSNDETFNEELDAAWADVADRWRGRFYSSRLKPLSPEQMAASVMQALGITQQRMAQAKKKAVEKSKTDKETPDAASLGRLVESTVYKESLGDQQAFVSIFAQGAGQTDDYQATVHEALFLSNGGKVQSWLAPKSGNLTERLMKQNDTANLAQELYLSLLTRLPDADEISLVEQHLEGRDKDRKAAIVEMISALLCSTEFRFNH